MLPAGSIWERLEAREGFLDLSVEDGLRLAHVEPDELGGEGGAGET